MQYLLLAQGWLIGASFYFYAQWKAEYLLLLVSSILINYLIAFFIQHYNKKAGIFIGTLFNLGLLGYFKYTNFFINTMNEIEYFSFDYQEIILPLAISFFTFQQIAYLADCYSSKHKTDSNLLRYCLFVSFFPQLIAGPIVHHSEMMPQFTHGRIELENIAKGMAMFSIGLFKKVVIADTLAIWANEGFSHVEDLSLINAWLTSLSYTFQLYFDFSGYADMAIGIALLFSITLPLNFNSPYQSTNIQQFWRSWHITLSRWFKDYVYFPLGGSRLGQLITLRNLFMVTLLSGLWHGAGWTFILWGLMHALALIAHRVWTLSSIKLPTLFAWTLTFLFINMSWVMFRADSIHDAKKVYQAMFSIKGIESFAQLKNQASLLYQQLITIDAFAFFDNIQDNKILAWITLMFCLLSCLHLPNSQQLIGIKQTGKFSLTKISPTILMTLLALSSLIVLAFGQYSEFIYFNF